MLLKGYLNRPEWSQVNNPEIMSTLSEFEKELSKRYERLHVRQDSIDSYCLLMRPYNASFFKYCYVCKTEMKHVLVNVLVVKFCCKLVLP